MAFEPKQIVFSKINGGVEFTERSTVSPTDINDWFKSGAYNQKSIEVFSQEIDTSELNKEGQPSVSVLYKNTDGVLYPYLKFTGLKGIKGDSGLSNGASLSNEFGESDENGYTQKAVNSIVSNPNLLINGDFRINQRGKTLYENDGYTVDRWYSENLYVTRTQSGINLSPISSGNGFFTQVIEGDLTGKTVTLSLNVNGTIYAKSFTLNTDINFNAWNNALNIVNGQVTMVYDNNSNFYAVAFDITSNINISYVKVENGFVATSFSPRPYAEEMSMCRRYFQRINSEKVGYRRLANGSITTNKRVAFVLNFEYMRIRPTITLSDLSAFQEFFTGAKFTSLASNNTSENSVYLEFETDLQVNNTTPAMLYAVTQGNNYIDIDAEFYNIG